MKRVLLDILRGHGVSEWYARGFDLAYQDIHPATVPAWWQLIARWQYRRGLRDGAARRTP